MLPPGLSIRSTTALDAVVEPGLADLRSQRIAADRSRRRLAIDDLTRRDDDRDIAVLRLLEACARARGQQIGPEIDRAVAAVVRIALAPTIPSGIRQLPACS